MATPWVSLATCTFADLAAAWPATAPLIVLGGSGRYLIAATSWREVSWDEVAPLSLGPGPGGDSGSVPALDFDLDLDLPFSTGYIGLIPYDLYAPSLPTDPSAKPRVFRVNAALVHDRVLGRLHRTGQSPAEAGFTTLDSAAIVRSLQAQGPQSNPAPPLTLHPLQTDSAYQQLVAQVLADIRAGRYYQLNLLRYFTCGAALQRRWVAARLDRYGGPFSAWFSLPDLELVSFSPERFARGLYQDGRLQLQACPIKGTASRHVTQPETDQAAGLALLRSSKDLAELHMIIDLMRHDLYPVCVAGSLKVVHAARLLTLATLFHLEGELRGRLRPDLTLGQLLAALCPAGSITGAPKKAVMQAIRSYEGRPRGYVMGHAFYASDGGGFDLSILIRTLVQAGPGTPVQFAAGSGLVIGSQPHLEQLEIAAKTLVVTGS